MSAPKTSALERALLRFARARPPTGRYLVGVSGGRDSVALLHALLASGFRRLVICHLDHGIRGAASRRDARFVEKLAAGCGLPVEIGREDVPALARAGKCSLETAGREARYRFFAQVSCSRRCSMLLLGHHADDQVETFLFNLLRGAGPAGLAAMSFESTRLVSRRRLRVFRPLLGVWRSEIDEYVDAHRLKYREDATNADPAAATRNRLRSEVLPMLERVMGREVRPALWRAADLIGAEDAWLSEVVAADLAKTETLPVRGLRAEPVAKQRRLIRAWLHARKVKDVGYAEVESVRGLLDVSGGPAKINVPGGLHVRRRAGALFIDRTES